MDCKPSAKKSHSPKSVEPYLSVFDVYIVTGIL